MKFIIILLLLVSSNCFCQSDIYKPDSIFKDFRLFRDYFHETRHHNSSVNRTDTVYFRNPTSNKKMFSCYVFFKNGEKKKSMLLNNLDSSLSKMYHLDSMDYSVFYYSSKVLSGKTFVGFNNTYSYISYHENGLIASTSYQDRGNGMIQTQRFDMKGNLIEMSWSDTYIDSTDQWENEHYTFFYSSGEVLGETIEMAGKQKCVMYNLDGSLKEEGYIMNLYNTRIGEWREFYPDGEIKLKSQFDDVGNKSGVWKYFNKAGELIKEESHF